MYVAEVDAPHRRHDLNLIFRALPSGPMGGLELISLNDEEACSVLPPVDETALQISPTAAEEAKSPKD